MHKLHVFYITACVCPLPHHGRFKGQTVRALLDLSAPCLLIWYHLPVMLILVLVLVLVGLVLVLVLACPVLVNITATYRSTT